MSIEVQFSNGLTLPAREAVLSRALGRAVRWTYEVFIPPDKRTEHLPKLAEALGSKRVTAQAKFQQPKAGTTSEFGLEGVVTHSWWGKDADHVVVEVQNTVLKDEDPNPLLPRWRVHHVDDLQKLAQKFEHLARMASSPVKNALSGVTFPDKERANVVQGGVSDWDFVAMLLWQYRLLSKNDDLKPMIVSGSVDKATQGRWVYTWGSKKAFEAAGEVSQRTITFAKDDGYERPMFAGASGEEPGLHSILPGARLPRTGLLRHRRPFGKEWNDWRSKDAPLFLDGKMCWRVVDRLYETGDPESLGWTTMLEFLAPEGLAPEEHPPQPFRAWTGLGKVKQNYLKGPWLDVELPAFHREKQENLVYSRLTTIHSGKDGHAGLHLIPEANTHVEVAWSGRFDESVVCLGNYRMKQAQHPHPSVWIESDSIGKFTNILIKKIGQTTIESDWLVDVEKQVIIRSRQPMKLVADGVKAHYKGGVIHVSKGPVSGGGGLGHTESPQEKAKKPTDPEEAKAGKPETVGPPPATPEVPAPPVPVPVAEEKPFTQDDKKLEKVQEAAAASGKLALLGTVSALSAVGAAALIGGPVGLAVVDAGLTLVGVTSMASKAASVVKFAAAFLRRRLAAKEGRMDAVTARNWDMLGAALSVGAGMGAGKAAGLIGDVAGIPGRAVAEAASAVGKEATLEAVHKLAPHEHSDHKPDGGLQPAKRPQVPS